VGGSYKVVVRRRGGSEKERHATLDRALDALEARLRELAARQEPRTVRAFTREIEPRRQVAVRGEVSGPGGLRAGVDVRGDGSAEAFTGRVARRLVEQRDGEDAYSALRRVVHEDGG
jgi:hypothetical protein